jgi:hypothetical protein
MSLIYLAAHNHVKVNICIELPYFIKKKRKEKRKEYMH